MAGTRSAALDPTSVPFRPASIRASDDEGGNSTGWAHGLREQDRGSVSSHSVSPSEYRSVRSSPSPPRTDPVNEGVVASNPPPAQAEAEGSLELPTVRQFDAVKPYPTIEARVPREVSMLGSLDTLSEGEHPVAPTSTAHAPGTFFIQKQGREQLSTPPVPVNNGSWPSSFHTNGVFASASPVSSVDSGSHFTPSVDQPQSFESQLTASPMIHDILTRLVRCESSTREIKRDLSDVHRKVNLLVERSLGVGTTPEFKDPFAPANANGHTFPHQSHGFRQSMGGNIAPNQPAPSDDIIQISQRLNTLTSSVGQLLALQTQQHTHSSAGLPSTHVFTNAKPDLVHNPVATPHISPNPSILGHGLPNRPDLRPSPRAPNTPIRTWSAGALELPGRPPDAGISRSDPLLRDKRRSASGLSRRDSSGVRLLLQTRSSYTLNFRLRSSILRATTGQALLVISDPQFPNGNNSPLHLNSCGHLRNLGKYPGLAAVYLPF
jgi:hypothetical protein